VKPILIAGALAFLASFGLPGPSAAIPICPSATLEDYVGLGSDGCQAGKITFSSFSYDGTPSAEQVFAGTAVQGNFSALNLTAFAWGSFGLSFAVAGPGIMRNELAMISSFIGPFDTGSGVVEIMTPGGFLSVSFSRACTRLPPPPAEECTFFDRIDLPAVDTQFIRVSGGAGGGAELTDVSVGFGVAPEPATLVLWGLGGAGLAVGHWVKRRSRQRDACRGC
jgi:hypothetical protein